MTATRVRTIFAIMVAAILNCYPAAAADHSGGFRSSGSSANGDCLTIGANIAAALTPDKHNIVASNSCATNYSLDITQYKLDEDGFIVAECQSGPTTNYAQCAVQSTTAATDHWEWAADIYYGGVAYETFCFGSPTTYSQCYQSTD